MKVEPKETKFGKAHFSLCDTQFNVAINIAELLCQSLMRNLFTKWLYSWSSLIENARWMMIIHIFLTFNDIQLWWMIIHPTSSVFQSNDCSNLNILYMEWKGNGLDRMMMLADKTMHLIALNREIKMCLLHNGWKKSEKQDELKGGHFAFNFILSFSTTRLRHNIGENRRDKEIKATYNSTEIR